MEKAANIETQILKMKDTGALSSKQIDYVWEKTNSRERWVYEHLI